MTIPADRPAPTGSSRLGPWIFGIAIAAVVGVSLARLIQWGFAPVAPDDAQYIGVGRALWGLQKPLGIDGSLYTIRSWVYPLMLGGPSRLFDDPVLGPKVLAWILGTGALALAVTIAYRLARAPGAVVTALAVLATPLFWTLVPSTYVDVALVAFIMLVLLVISKPTAFRMILAGVLVGLTLLVKETSAPLVFLPLAYLGSMPFREWRGLATRFVLAFAVTVGWWFLTVLFTIGEIFPLEGFRQAQDRNLPRAWSLTSSGLLLIALWVFAWIVVVAVRRHDARARLLMVAGLAFVPASLIAWLDEFAPRQFAPFALLSSIALGVAVAEVIGFARTRSRGWVRPALAVGAGVLAAVALVSIALTQDRVDRADSSAELDRRIAARITGSDPLVISTFRFEHQLWARTAERARVKEIAFTDGTARPLLPPSVWVDCNDGICNAMPRKALGAQLRGADYLVLTGPHRFGPIGLATWLTKHGERVGIVPVAKFRDQTGVYWAHVYRLDAPDVDAIPTVVSTRAAERMVKLGGLTLTAPTVIAGERSALRRLTAALPAGSFEPLPAPQQ